MLGAGEVGGTGLGDKLRWVLSQSSASDSSPSPSVDATERGLYNEESDKVGDAGGIDGGSWGETRWIYWPSVRV